MRIAVVSDTHSHNKGIIETLSSMERMDLLIHLGDFVGDGEKISKALGLPAVIVRGNGDLSSSYKDYELIELEGKKIFLTHGHLFQVRFNINKLYYKALELGADIALFGHTHIPVNLARDDLIIMNPGSPSYPRGGSLKKTFGLIELAEDIKTEILTVF